MAVDAMLLSFLEIIINWLLLLLLFLATVHCRNSKKVMIPEDQQLVAQLEQKILKRKAQINEIEQSLPKKNSLYLKVSRVESSYVTDPLTLVDFS